MTSNVLAWLAGCRGYTPIIPSKNSMRSKPRKMQDESKYVKASNFSTSNSTKEPTMRMNHAAEQSGMHRLEMANTMSAKLRTS